MTDLPPAKCPEPDGGWLPVPALRRHSGAVTQHELGATTMAITAVGIDLIDSGQSVRGLQQPSETAISA